MDRIIFNNVLRGFPADEKFMQIVDQNATSITNVCIALFGKTPTIVCGLNVTRMNKQGVTDVTVDDGFLWTGDDLIPVKGNVFSGIDPDIDLYISTTSTTEQCTFFDGNLYDAYYSNKGTVVNAQLNPSTKYPFRLSTIVRANICQSVVSDIDVSDMFNEIGQVKGTLRQTVYSDGRVNIRGLIAVLNIVKKEELYKRGIAVTQLPINNVDIDTKISSGKTRMGNVYPAAITFEGGIGFLDERKVSFAHFVKMTDRGTLNIYIPYDKLAHTTIEAMVYLDAYISVDFTYNSRK